MANISGGVTQFTPIATTETPFRFKSGEILSSGKIAYKTYGQLNRDRTNAILIFPVLTTSQHLAGFDSQGPGTPYWAPECYEGWWGKFVGPGKAFDTDVHYFICANYLGGCFGSLGPEEIDPMSGMKFGKNFPRVSVEDIVDSQLLLLDHLQISTLHALVGASFGGLLGYDLATRHPSRVKRVISIASGSRLTPETRHLNLAQILSIEMDRDFQEENEGPENPCRGLFTARLIAMGSYVNLTDLEARPSIRASTNESAESIHSNQCWAGQAQQFHGSSHPAERFFIDHARNFGRRFSPHSYLRILGAWQGFQPHQLCRRKMSHQTWLQFSIYDDACFPGTEQWTLKEALDEVGIPNQLYLVDSRKGHDSFLTEPEKYQDSVRQFLGLR
jgi:homoserine O-acetyltransferase